MPNAVPNYLTVDASGAVSANFPGGVTIQEGAADGTYGTLQNGHAVTWKRAADGAAVAQVAAKATDSTPEGVLAWLQARQPDQLTGASLVASATAGNANISAICGNYPGAGVESVSLLNQNAPGDPGYSELCRVFNLNVVTGSDIFHASASVPVNNATLRLLVMVSTTAYCVGPIGLFVYQIFWDGVPLSPTQKFFFNTTGEHHTLPTIAALVPGLVMPGVHGLGMTGVAGTTATVTADFNDGYTITTIG